MRARARVYAYAYARGRRSLRSPAAVKNFYSKIFFSADAYTGSAGKEKEKSCAKKEKENVRPGFEPIRTYRKS